MRIRVNRAVLSGLTLALTSILNWTAIPALSGQPAGVDPTFAFSTYLGGSLSNYVGGIAVDSSGNTYVVGSTNSSDFPTTPGAFQPSYAGIDAANGGDAFIAKLSPTGSLIYSTYLGGSGYDQASAITVDSVGDAYVTGVTHSKDFPTTPGALRTQPGESGGAFVTKLNPTGTALVYSTFLQVPAPYGIAVDSDGNAYLTGENAFVTKLNAAGTALLYSTLLAGNGKDVGNAIAIDSAGDAYVAGFTTSTNFPTTPGAFRERHRDALKAEPFVTKLNASGTALVYSTLLGGSSSGVASGIAVDSSGSAYVAGSTSSTDFPTTTGAFQRIYGGGQSDVFVSRLNSDGSSLVYSTYIGGGGSDGASGIALDAVGNAYVAGSTASNGFPVTNALQRANASELAFKSNSGGAAWDVANNRLTADGVSSMVIDPIVTSTIYAATDRGVFKSRDSGTTWEPVNQGLTALDVRALAIDPMNTSVLYAVPSDDPGVFRSTDGGGSWRETSQTTGVLCVAVDPMTPSTVYAGGSDSKGAGVYKSIDGGNTWGLARITAGDLNAKSFVKLVTIDPKSNSTVYAGVTQGQFEIELYDADSIVKSTDGGGTWGTTGLRGITLQSMAIDPQNSSTLYVAAGEDGVLKSSDGGDTWKEINEGLPSHDVASLAIDPAVTSILYAGTPSGVFKSTNGGAVWGSTALANVSISLFGIDPRNTSTVYAADALKTDAFVAKLNPGGSALVYSTYLGGRGDDNGYAVAVDLWGAACITGITNSPDFPTANSLEPPRSNYHSAFVARIMPSQLTAAPRVISASISRKDLVVFGENFNDGAVIVVNGDAQKTSSDLASPTSRLIGAKSGKRIGRGQSAIIQVRNSDGALSEPFGFTRPFD